MNFQLERVENQAPAAGLSVTVLDLSNAESMPEHGYMVDAPPSIRKSQIYCRRCHRSVRETQQTGLQCGRRIILCKFFCHGEEGEIRICQDQLSSGMRFEVFEGLPALMPHAEPTRPALPSSAPERVETPKPDKTAIIDIEATVVTEEKIPIATPGGVWLTKGA